MNKNINDTYKFLKIKDKDIEILGKYKAKILKRGNKKAAKLILVTATSPTPYGEGKTTISIALNDALNKLGYAACASLRQPSLGPVFGTKGGATGGGKSQIINSEDVNLHFTGDFHAITSANNLIASIIDNHIFQGNTLNIDATNIILKRCLDVNDRSLRSVKINDEDSSFVITAASDIMAILCMAKDIDDLRVRLEVMIVAKNIKSKYVYLKELNCVDAVLILLRDAVKPNLTHSLAGSPVIIHGGPFANIALGCSSVLGTKTALTYSDYVITEAGFGSDLGAEKFIDIKKRISNIPLDCVVLVTTIRSIKYNCISDAEDNLDRIKEGIVNLYKHVDNIVNIYRQEVIVALNVFENDSKDEIDYFLSLCKDKFCVSLCYPYTKGTSGTTDLAKKVIEVINSKSKNKNYKDEYVYNLEDSLENKILKVAQNVYGANGTKYSYEAIKQIESYNKSKYSKLPICIAKTQYSLSDNAKLLGAPKDFDINVEDIYLNSGAGFFVIKCGDIMTMPGLGKSPNYTRMSINKNGIINGLN